MKSKDELLAEAHTILSFLYLRDDLNLSIEAKSDIYDLWFEEGKQFVKDYRDSWLEGNL